MNISFRDLWDGLSWAHKMLKKNRKFSLVKLVFPVTDTDHEIEVKCSVTVKNDGKNPKSLRAYVHSAETIALQEIAQYLSNVPIKLKFSSFYGRPQENRNLLLIGSGAYNELAGEIMQDMGELSYIKPTNSHAYFTYSNIQYRCQHSDDPDHRVLEDYGVILRKSVGDNKDKVVLLLAGIHMHGTQAAAKIAMTSEFQQKIKKARCKYYAQLVKVSVAENGLSPQLNGFVWENLPFIKL